MEGKQGVYQQNPKTTIIKSPQKIRLKILHVFYEWHVLFQYKCIKNYRGKKDVPDYKGILLKNNL